MSESNVHYATKAELRAAIDSARAAVGGEQPR